VSINSGEVQEETRSLKALIKMLTAHRNKRCSWFCCPLHPSCTKQNRIW